LSIEKALKRISAGTGESKGEYESKGESKGEYEGNKGECKGSEGVSKGECKGSDDDCKIKVRSNNRNMGHLQ
jgi:hypothetical protein